MQEEQIRTALNTHWHASAVGDATAEHAIYDDDALCDYPQSGERILGRSNLLALRSHHHQHGQRVDPVGDPDFSG